MNGSRPLHSVRRVFLLAALFPWAMQASAHGGVVFEEDICVIKIGFLTAHFTIYQPETSASQEYCEDVPDVTDTIFVLDYLHDSMKEMPVDFRIIRDVEGLGLFAQLADIEQMDDLESNTVLYRQPTTESDAVLTVDHTFIQAGSYIGVVTAHHPTLDKTYSAVFPFRVGGADYGYLPIFLALGALAQLSYWISNGTVARWRAKLAAARA
jgi:hypothetical protein